MTWAARRELHSGLGLDIVEDAGDNFIFSLIFLFLA
jgi:hypothetical protein